MGADQNKAVLTIKMGPLAHGGACVGVVVDGDACYQGKKAFVREVVPGETVKASLLKDEKNFLKAELKEIVSESQFRVVPPCPLFGTCGGCDLQHMDLNAQRQAKRDMIESMLIRQAGIRLDKKVELIGTDLPGYNYRRRVSLHLDRHANLGYFKPETNAVVPVEYCYIADEKINAALAEISQAVRKLCVHIAGVVIEVHDNEVFVELKGRENPKVQSSTLPDEQLQQIAALIKNLQVTFRRHPIYLQYHGKQCSLTEAYPAGHFSQVNEKANQILQEQVCNCVETDDVSDLFGGAGNFAIPLCGRGKKVDLVEADRELVLHADRVRRKEGIAEKLLMLYVARCEQFVKENRLKSTLVLDPPRGGAREVVEHCMPSITQRIVYVSCNLPTLGRDLGVLVSRGYRVDNAFVLDMFPQTHFAEIIAVLGPS